MTSHLLLVTLGPVQEFIAQARRTRDLWYGSHLLSELARAAARELAERGAVLIFPALDPGDPELHPCLAPQRPTGKPPLNVANKLLAEGPDGVDPKELARSTRDAVLRFWREGIAAPVKRACVGLLAPGIDAVWDEQINTFVEFTAAWAPLAGYAETRRQVEAAVAGRKNLRDFVPWTEQRGNVPKSSLDGARETVLAEPRSRDVRLVHRYRITEGEQLDAVGLVKRAGGEPEQFVPLVNVALAKWIELVSDKAAGQLEALRNACQRLGVAPVKREDLPCARAFPFDASVFLASRWGAVFEEQGLDGDPEEWGKQHVRPILERLVEPYPYVACVVADGDRMGKAIDRLTSPEEHRSFCRALAKFPTEARRIIEQQHVGVLIYSGGDDILGFLPVAEAVPCADNLRRAFAARISSACSNFPGEERPTLSVGIGIGHVMERMGDLLELGREAQRLAKRTRDSLGIIVDKRSGGRRVWAAQWTDNPANRLQQDAILLKSRLSSRKVYEIASLLRRLPQPELVKHGPAWTPVLWREVRRCLSRVAGGALSPDDVGLEIQDSGDYGQVYRAASSWVDRMLIASTFAKAVPEVSPAPGEVPV